MANTNNLLEQFPREITQGLPNRFLTEDELCRLLRTTKRALRQRPDSAKPPGRCITPRNRVYDAEEVAAWIASLPRSK